MTGAAYSRYDRRGALVFDPQMEVPRVAIYDLGSQDPSLSFEIKLRQLPHRLRLAPTLILRGVTDFYRAELEAAAQLPDTVGAGTAIYELAFEPSPLLRPHLGAVGLDADKEAELLRRVQQVELRALLDWTESIWQSGEQFHFALPSGQHSDTFVRAADVFSDVANVAYIADWLQTAVGRNTAIICDTPTLLPLSQELEIRALRMFSGARTLKSHVLRYRPPIDLVREQVQECVSWLQQDGEDGVLLCLVSVSATGGFIGRLQGAVADIADEVPVTFAVLCNVGVADSVSSLTTVQAQHYPPAGCRLCERGSRVVEIDQRRFTSRIVSAATVVSLPSASVVEEYTSQLAELDQVGALAVHVDRPGEHDHLSVYIDTRKALEAAGFRAAAERELRELYPDGGPDIVVLPLHGDSEVLQEWLHAQGYRCAPPLPAQGDAPADLVDAIANASRILVCDDAVMTSKTMRGVLQHVQRIKGSCNDNEFDLRAFALIARTEDAGTWAGLRNRFFIEHRFRLRTTWIAPLPAPGRSCPWCHELAALADLAPRLSGLERDHLERRLARLRDPSGMRDHIFLGSEAGAIEGEFDDGIRVTPQSYLGSISEIGAYVGAALLMQHIRNDWKKREESLHQRLVVPTAKFLRQYTDPILAAGLLRAAKPRELWSSETQDDLLAALFEIDHSRQHPVVIAEAMWSATRDKLPVATLEMYAEHLNGLPVSTGSWLRRVVEE